MNNSTEKTAFDVMNSIPFAISWLVWPVSFSTFTVLGWRCYKERKFIEALPLLASQFLSALIWACVAAEQIGFFNYKINGTQIQNDKMLGLRFWIINFFTGYLTYLEPLNMFLYTWRFLAELELESTH